MVSLMIPFARLLRHPSIPFHNFLKLSLIILTQFLKKENDLHQLSVITPFPIFPIFNVTGFKGKEWGHSII